MSSGGLGFRQSLIVNVDVYIILCICNTKCVYLFKTTSAMKRLLCFILTLTLVSMVMSSCTKESLTEKDISGRWKTYCVSHIYYQDGKLIDKQINDSCDLYYILDLKKTKEGTLVYYNNKEIISNFITWETMDGLLLITPKGESDIATFIISDLQGKNMVLTMQEQLLNNKTHILRLELEKI